MLITLDSDGGALADLPSFLRAGGCIAYAKEEIGEIEALRPQAFGEQETAEIIELVERWLADQRRALPLTAPATPLRGSSRPRMALLARKTG